MRRLVFGPALAGLAALPASCAGPPPAAPDAPVVASPLAEGLDGVYRPPPLGARGTGACGGTLFRNAIRVRGGTASMQTVAGGELRGVVAPDGSLLAKQGVSALRGQFTGDKFVGSYSRNHCVFVLRYSK